MATLIRRRKLGMTSVREISALSKTGIKHCRNDQGIPEDDIYIRWGCTANVPNKDAKIINKAKAIHQVCDKISFRKLLNAHGLCPTTWFNYQEYEKDNPIVGYNPPIEPVVIRPPSHSRGLNLAVANNAIQLSDTIQKFSRKFGGYYISPLINKVAEYRVFVVSGRVACVAQKTPGNPQDVAWNVAKGGRFDNVRWGDWPMNVVDNAIKAFNLTELDFGGVDVMVDADGKCYTLEINSAPSLTSPYRQQCMAKCFDHIVLKGRERIQSTKNLTNWKQAVHPAVSDSAII